MNKFIFIGNLGKDVQVQRTSNGGEYATISIGCDGIEKTEWFTVCILDQKNVELAKKIFHKGVKMCVEGRIHNKQWTDTNGQTRTGFNFIMEKFELIRMRDTPQNGDFQQTQTYGQNPNQQYGTTTGARGIHDVPF